MKAKDALLEEIKDKLLENTGIVITYSDRKKEHGRIVQIKNERFIVVVKPEITQGNKGIVLQQLKDVSKKANLPVLLITKYIPSAIVKSFVEEGISYVDAAGNCNIQQHNLLLIIEGKKIERLPKTNQARAFQEAGIKLIYCLLANPDNINKSFRELSDLSQISLGSVSTIIQELVYSKFILKTKNKKVLKNKTDLLKRWVIAYNDTLRPKLFIKKMSFINKSEYQNWNYLNLSSISEKTRWGGECAANILTKSLTPAHYTIYTDEIWQSVGKSLKLMPDDNGKIEILRLFYNEEEGNTVSPLLIYADLMGSGDSRNIETAEIILNNELQYLK
ncbi:hypothetical protein M2459_000834 [Parabacteroides sp. PF5-5]|uniref:type IV toxin-antitoxin system AbiEi family antitoxin n=1 Tax=unclassified Parabacteroides TaxID=2649774 RepID=UPI002475C744|nr:MULTISPECIES: type IV toxin-antitoxin system AbiEi family antitoxin [unclassified Parabacteroides]MDH6304122.1 hypothetical protein [Parabacteroides sp. PH5-39]MDH6315178.1 hypothetical protein [Parabacteroides sp. PF5-13]MDH6318823.1 hypothetical protein [Parabacteroides sp. PH5-13]MDH6322552.1 hypothetical protein [Parabacteroides sp. PH5-8]MDH6326296.1 hypothetical protein [Parabacteroides sp. PH5-41]